MTCSGYQPKFQKQLDGSAFAGVNCTCASAGMAADDDTCGQVVPSPNTVRRWTGDRSGGTTLAEVDIALTAHTPTRLDVRYRFPWSEVVRRVNAGASAILQGGYAPIADSRFDGGGGFRGNHAILVTPGLVAMDPLADGRRSGIYKYHGEAYPESLLRRFAARLNLETGDRPPRYLGDGLAYVAFARDNDADYEATVRPLSGQAFRYYTRFFVSSGRVTGHERRRTRGFQAKCTPPTLVVTQSGDAKVSLVRITEGGYAGFWISSKWSDPA
jgi:hypothetical protein